jgi:hypothetical protein
LRSAGIHATADSAIRPTDLCTHSQQIYSKKKIQINQEIFKLFIETLCKQRNFGNIEHAICIKNIGPGFYMVRKYPNVTLALTDIYNSRSWINEIFKKNDMCKFYAFGGSDRST